LGVDSKREERPFYTPQLDLERDLKRVGFSDTKQNLAIGPNVAVLVIDMSPIFVDELLFPRVEKGTGKQCVQAIKAFLDGTRALDLPIIYTTGYVFKSEAESGAWMYRFPPEQRHRVAAMDSPGLHEIVEDIAPGEKDLVILKEKPSAFFGTQLQSILNHHKTDTVIITGMSTSGCVRATAVDAFSLNYKVVIPRECVADSRRASHEIALYDIDAQTGDVRPMADVIEALRGLQASG
jgi:nicotinamidase-related amidase